MSVGEGCWRLLQNFCYIIEGVLAGCAHPAASPDLQGALTELVGRGIGALVSLDEWGIPIHEIAEFGLQYLHLPVPDFGTPTLDQARRFVDFVNQQRRRGIAVAVHCRAGYGRTGTMLACYLVTLGLAAAEAIAAVRQKRPGSIETLEQEEFVYTFERAWREGAPPESAG